MATNQGADTTVTRRHRANLEAFVLRARRVRAHSLAADQHVLRDLAWGKLDLSFQSGEARIRQQLPGEELVESAAARVRPLFLEGEDCSVLKALAALGFFCQSIPEEAARVKALRRAWRARVDETSSRKASYLVMVGDATTGSSVDLDSLKLAMAWIYGDVVHHDRERRQEADAFGLDERYRAAVPLVAWTIRFAIVLLDYTAALQDGGALGLDPEVFDHQVVLESTTWEQTGRMYSAPVGTAEPLDVHTALGPDWTEVSGAAGLGAE
jgi:hypothetical protein